MRPTLYGNRQAVSAGHYLAAAAGTAILDSGGNAIDAGCCAGMALAVLHPDEVNFGGDAPIIIRLANGEVITIAGRLLDSTTGLMIKCYLTLKN